MPLHSISFVLVFVFLGFLVGGVGASLTQQVFGFSFLSYKLFDIIIDDFYIIHKLHVYVTTGSLLGFALTGGYLYRKFK